MQYNQVNSYRSNGFPEQKKFITEWTVGTMETITLPLIINFNYSFEVEWGDGSSSIITSYNDPDLSHTYSVAGTYNVKIGGLCEALRIENNAITRLQVTDVIQWGDVGMRSLNFRGCSNFPNTLAATDVPVWGLSTSLTSLFRGCTQLQTIPNIEIWEMSNVFSIASIFNGLTLFNQDISGWNTGNVLDMTGAFSQATGFNQSIDSWNVTKVTNFNQMFEGTNSFNQSLNSWILNTSADVNMTNMFFGSAFNGNISSWNTSRVTIMAAMFKSAPNFNQNISSWDVSNVVNMTEMFRSASSFNQPIGSWITTSLTNISSMFRGATIFNQPLNNWNVSSVTTMLNAFFGAQQFNQDLNNWNVRMVQNFGNCFRDCFNFNGDITNWETVAATSMSGMFHSARVFDRDIATNVDVWDVSGVNSFGSMFRDAQAFNQNIDNWDVSSGTSFGFMFDATVLFNQPLNSWDVSSSTGFGNFMRNNPVFDQPLNNWTINNLSLVDMNQMFQGASSMNQDLSSWDVSMVNNLSGFGDGANFDIDNYTNMLIGWDAQNVQPGLTWDMGTSRYSCELGQAAWDNLTNSDGWTINDGGCVEWNTLIGGVGATLVTSKADFAAMSSVSESDIYAFNIDVSNNVSFVLLQNYTIVTLAFDASSDLTYYLDNDGYCTSFSRFFNCPNLEHVYLPSVTDFVDQLTLHDAAGLKKMNMESMASINDRLWVTDAENLKKLDLRSLTGMPNTQGGGSFVELRRLERFYLGSLTSMSSSELNRILIGNTGRNPSFMFNGDISGNMKVYHSSTFGVADRAAFTRIIAGWQIGDTCTINGLVYTAVNGAPATDGEFDCSVGQSSNQRHTNFRNAINADTRPGSADISCISDNAFACVRATAIGVGGNSITAVMGAGNTGSAFVRWSPFKYGNDVHHSLVDMRDIEGATLVEVGAPISVDPPTGVSVSNITANTVDVNFTAPTPNANGNDGYEVWLDDGGRVIKLFEWDEISASGDTISGLQSGTDYDLIMRTIDGEYNFSAFTSIVQFTTL